MKRSHAAFALAMSALLALCGCPTSPESLLDTYAGSRGGGPATGNNAGGTPGGSTVGGASLIAPSLSDGLSAEFPGCSEPLEAASWRAEILRLVNLERARAGLNTLARSQVLENQAEQYACELIHYDFFDHVNPVTGSHLDDRAEAFGYDYYVIGENLAAGQRTPRQAFDDWMASPGHRANIMDPRFEEIGIGIRTGGDYGLYWVQEFGKPYDG